MYVCGVSRVDMLRLRVVAVPLHFIKYMYDMPCMLVVDDDDLFRELLIVMLRRVRPHAQIAWAANGHAAYLWHQQHRAHLIITDDVMPVLSGMALLQRLRATHDPVPVLVLTSRYTSRLELVPDPSTVIVSKPVTIPVLLGYMDRLLADHADV